MSCAPRSTGLFTDRLTAASLAAARERFDERHAQIHGHAAKERPVEVVSYRLRVRVDVPKYQPRQEATPSRRSRAMPPSRARRKVHFGGKAAVDATLYERDKLGVGAMVTGPAIVEQFDATTVIPPGWTGRVDGYRNLILESGHDASVDRRRAQVPSPVGRGRGGECDGHGISPPHPSRKCVTTSALAITAHRRSVTMDAITIQILRNKIASLVDEMHYHFYRSGYSTIIRESRDFSCVIVDRDGRLIVAPPMFFHAPVYRHLVGRILETYGKAGAINEGDVFVSNHPYEGGLPHVSDMAFVAPVFADGKIVAFSGSIAHKADVGGAVPGSTSANATEMYPRGPAAAADQDLGRRPARSRHRAHHPDQQPAAGADARRHPRPDRRHPDGRGARQGAVRRASAPAR